LKPILDEPTPGYENDPEHKKKAGVDAEFAAASHVTLPPPPQTPKE